MPAIPYQKASETAAVTVGYVRTEQAHREAVESKARIQRHLNCLTTEAWGKAGKDWASSAAPEYKSPNIALAVDPRDVMDLKVALMNLGYSLVTEKHVPVCSERGYECEAYTEVRIFVAV